MISATVTYIDFKFLQIIGLEQLILEQLHGESEFCSFKENHNPLIVKFMSAAGIFQMLL